MKRLIVVLATICVLAAVAVTQAVAGGSSGKGGQTITATCTVLGTVTVHASSGQSAWVGDTHYIVLKFSGTFTPTTGPAQTFTKTYGKKTAFHTTYTCTGSQSDSSGTFSFTATVAKTPH
jgi:hypothetical protein